MDKNNSFDLQLFLPYLLNQAAEESSLAFQKIYKGRYGMLRTDWRVLFHLGIYGQMSAKEIGARARIHKTKVSRAVQRLADRRFLTRSRDDADRRFERLALTSAGRAAYCDLRDVAEDYENALIEGMEPAEVHALRRVLLRLAKVQSEGAVNPPARKD